ncbi:hypothetical protein E2C01_091488 [Portunus trituberculatus]|uniref:Uncharacterized protein n=1 Tax=Portunus trituberculatus TaxID=210409 RepID=A0A5B7JE27_PORTR|nr:hypothetical protein [Portunus trituberculatus]
MHLSPTQNTKVHTPAHIAPIHFSPPTQDDGKMSETVRLALEGKCVVVAS